MIYKAWLLAILAALALGFAEPSKLCQRHSLKHESTYCSYMKQVDLGEMRSAKSVTFKIESKCLGKEINGAEIAHSVSIDGLSEELLSALFKFEVKRSSWLEISVSDSDLLDSLDGKSIKFKLFTDESSLLLTLDFSTTKLSNETFVFYEALSVEREVKSEIVELELKEILSEWCEQRYSITCLKCDSNLTLMIANDILQVKPEPGQSLISSVAQSMPQSTFQDLVIQIDQEAPDSTDDSDAEFVKDKRTLLVIRVYEMRDEYLERQKRFSHKKSSNASLVSSLSAKSLPQNGLTTLRPAQLVINEETIGLQTKVKIYEHVWSDYQIEASDYVKERIQLIAPDNPILNITKPFDYEAGGPIHSFHIIFTRKADKRQSKF